MCTHDAEATPVFSGVISMYVYSALFMNSMRIVHNRRYSHKQLCNVAVYDFQISLVIHTNIYVYVYFGTYSIHCFGGTAYVFYASDIIYKSVYWL